ncbi:MAG: hypothetical protein WDO18_06770 [Acidobacteriota bacterium]
MARNCALLSVPLRRSTAGEIDQRFLFIQLAEHLRRGLQCRELTVRPEQCELASGLSEGAVAHGRGHVLVFANDHCFERREKAFAIGGEVLMHQYLVASVFDDGHQVGCRHLLADEILRGTDRADLVGRRHGTQVEIQRNEAAIAVLEIEGALRRDLRMRQSRDGRDAIGEYRGGLFLRQLLEIEERDVLRHPIFSDGEVLRGEAFDRLTAFVFDRDLLDHQASVGPENRFFFGGRGWPGAGFAGCTVFAPTP